MRDIHLKRRKINLKEFRNRSAVEADIEELIDEDCRLFIDGRLACVYRSPVKAVGWLYDHCLKIKYSKDSRTNGLVTTSKVFGKQPRNTIRRDYCGRAALAWDQPAHHNALMRAGRIVAETYEESNADLYRDHSEQTESKVGPDWKLEGMPFTSGIVNENNPLKYHFDAGNYNGVWSGMLIFKKDISGGFLSLPEFGVGLACRSNKVFLFDGQGILHGVTPIKKTRVGGRRYTVVYYSMKGMWKCLPYGEEIDRIKTIRMEREERGLETKRVIPRKSAKRKK